MTTYTQLLADVQSWSARTDIADQIPTMVGLFENRVNRSLRTRQMESAFTGTTAANVLALPAGYLEYKDLFAVGYERQPVKPQTLEAVKACTTGIPTIYAIDGTNVRFDGNGSIEGRVYTKVPALVTNETNWLCTLAYDVYLFGTLAEVADYMKDTDSFTRNYERSKAILADIQNDDDRRKGPLVAVRR